MAISTVKATIRGQEVTLTYNAQTGKYEGTVTAPNQSSYNNNAGHYFPVTITARDTAGNETTVNDSHETLGNSLKLQVKEKVAPVITVTAPTASATLTNNKPTITWKVTDNDSGVNSGTISLTIDSTTITSGITKTAVTGGFNCSYTPSTALSDGSHTIKFNASDNDGNAATQATVTFKVDTVPPSLSVTSPTNNLVTNNSTLTVSGTTNDVTSSPCTVTVKLNNGNAQSVPVQSNGSFSTTVTLVNGTNTIVVTSTDSAGKSTTISRTVTLDTVAPTITAVTISPNPVDAGQTYMITVSVTD